MNFQILKLYKIPILLALSCCVFYFAFGYLLEREDFTRLILLYSGLCFMSFKLFQLLKHDFRLLFGLAIVFRLIFFFSFPELSQDYFRFIWDGKLISNGWNPYQYIPKELINVENFSIPIGNKLLEEMGSLSAGNYSNYPPLNQLIFTISGWFSGSSLLAATVILRIFIILADIGTVIFGSRLLKNLGMEPNRIFWFILNPFVIIEMTGNLHFESVMVFFLVWSLYLLQRKKWFLSAVVFGLSVSVKLLPLLFLPLLVKYFINFSGRKRNNLSKTDSNEEKLSDRIQNLEGFKRLVLYYLIIIAVVIVSFLPFYSNEVFQNYVASVGLWFGKFEFNASIYYLVRWLGFMLKGYNIIETAGKVLPLISFLVILIISFLRNYSDLKKLITNMLFAVSFYLLLSTTVHPWYLAIPLLLSVFTEFRYMMVWAVVVMFSYYAYSNPEFQENMWLVALEYSCVLGYFSYELIQKKKLSFWSKFFRTS